MTPTRDEVVAWIQTWVDDYVSLIGDEKKRDEGDRAFWQRRLEEAETALALLEQGRLDRERLDWVEAQPWVEVAVVSSGIDAATNDRSVQIKCRGIRANEDMLRDAIDAARGMTPNA